MEMKKWIFFLHNFIEPNHYAISECISEMISCGVQYTFVCKRKLRNPLSEKFVSNETIRLVNLPVVENFWREYDGVHVVYDGKSSLSVCALAYMFDVPYVITFHGGYDTNEKIYHKDVLEKTVWLCNHALAISVVCLEDKQTLIDLGIDADKINIVTPPINGLLLTKFIQSSIDKYRITIVGRLIPKKGVSYALKALQKMPSEYKLDVIGEGELLGDLMQLSKDLEVQDRVIWHGQLPLDETLRIVARNLIFWHPSIVAQDGNADGIPQIILYAMALGKFVVASDESHIGEVIQSGVNGYICKAKNPLSLAETTINNLCLYEQICDNACATAQIFFVDTQKDIYKKIYQIGGGL